MSFRLKTILGVALIEGVLLMVLVWSSMDTLRTTSEEALSKRAHTTARLLAATAKDAVLSTDLATLNAFVDEVLQAPGVSYVRVRDDEGVLAEAGEAPLPARPLAADDAADDAAVAGRDSVLHVDAAISEHGFDFGRVELGISAASLRELLASAQRRFLGIAALEMILVGLFSWMLGAYLTRTLTALEHGARTIVSGGPGVEVPVAGDDELSRTACAFNEMSRRLARTYARLKETTAMSRAAALRSEASEARMRAVFEAASDGILTVDASGRVEEANEAAASLFRCADAALAGRALSTLLVPEARAELETRLGAEAAFRGWETVGQRLDGDRFALDMSVNTMARDGRPGFVVLLRDISERLRIEQEVRSMNGMRSAMVEASLDALLTADEEGRLLEFSPAAEQIFGFAREEALGRPMAELIVPPDLRESHRAGMARYRDGGKPRIMGSRVETRAMRRGGEEFPVELAVVPMLLDDRTLFTAFVRDISERKRAERELLEAKKAAEEASAAKSRFLASMSHEIRTPLNGVLGTLELLLDGSLEERQREFTLAARASGEALRALIDDILDFSRIEAGHMELDPSAFDPSDLVEGVVEMLAPRAHDKGLAITAVVDPRVPAQVRADAGRLRQVLLNLVGNAVKFTHEGGVVLALRPTAGGLAFEVEDSGIGIEAGMHQQLFAEFVQADASDASRFGGSGLGLAISQRIVTMMGGRIDVRSEPGAGSTFGFTIEAETFAAPPAAPAAARLLVVDEDSASRTRLARMLGAQGHDVTCLDPLAAAGALPDGAFTGVLATATAWRSCTALVGAVEACPCRALLAHAGEEPVREDGCWDTVLRKPLRRAALAAWLAGERVESVAPSPSQTPHGGPPRGRLLLAEDSPTNRLVAVSLLQRAGYHVDVVEDGRAAVDAVQRMSYDAVLMDLRMPGMDGLEATATIRRLGGRAGSTPIVALTANAFQSDLERCAAAGMDDFVTKPVDRARLLAAVERWCASQPAPGRGAMGEMGDAGHKTMHRIEGRELLDERVLAQLAEDVSAANVVPMLRVFVEETRERLADMADAAGAQDLERLGAGAHTLKSGAGTFGALALQAVAEALETSCRAGDASAALSQWAQTRTLADATVDALESRCGVAP